MIGGSHKKTVGLFILLLAILFLLEGLGVFSATAVGLVWPIFLGIIGLMIMA